MLSPFVFVQTMKEKDIEGVRMVVDVVAATTLIAAGRRNDCKEKKHKNPYREQEKSNFS